MKRKGWLVFFLSIFLIGMLGLFSACDPNNNNDTTVPATPSNLDAVVHEMDIGVDLAWQDNADNEAGFVLQRKLNIEDESGFTRILGNLEPDTSSAVDNDTALLTGKAYQYRVKAFNDIGDSEYSDWAYAYIPPTGGSSEQVMMGFVYTAYAATDEKLWYTWEEPAQPGNYYTTYGILDASGQQRSGTDISTDLDPVTGFVYAAYVAPDSTLRYTWEDPNNPGSYYTTYSVSDASGNPQSGKKISIDYDPDTGLVYVGYVAMDDTLRYTWEEPAQPGNHYTTYAVSDASGNQLSGKDISIDFDPVTGFVYAGYVAMDDTLRYTWEEPAQPGNYYTIYAVSDASGNQQSGKDISIDFDPATDFIYAGYVAMDDTLRYTWEEPAQPGNHYTTYAVSDASGTQQSGTAVGITF